jgi:hypothetical protein
LTDRQSNLLLRNFAPEHRAGAEKRNKALSKESLSRGQLRANAGRRWGTARLVRNFGEEFVVGHLGPERVRPTYWTLDEHRRKHTHCAPLARALERVLPNDVPVLDLGCGPGHYLASLHQAGYRCLGVEGTPGIASVSAFDGIVQGDLSQPLSLDWPKSSILCLEVAEHLRLEDEQQLVDTIDQSCDEWLVISWAVPGQRGHRHVNERPNSYVYHRFTERGFAFQAAETFMLRESIDRNAKWFRNTIMVFRRG